MASRISIHRPGQLSLAAEGYVFVLPGLAAKRKVITVGQPQLKDDSICCPHILVTRSYEVVAYSSWNGEDAQAVKKPTLGS